MGLGKRVHLHSNQFLFKYGRFPPLQQGLKPNSLEPWIFSFCLIGFQNFIPWY